MFPGFLTIAFMAFVTYAFWREGLLTACTMFINVFLSGLIAFMCFEPIADLLDPVFADFFLHGYEDFLALAVLFCLSLGLLRLLTNVLALTDLEFHPAILRAGGVFFGLATGYLASGIIFAALQTLPWHVNFMGFEPKYDPNSPSRAIRSVLPPDRVWLGLCQYAGAYPFSNSDDRSINEPSSGYDRYLTFDKYSTFEIRYARHRRYTDDREPLPDLGEFDREVHRDQR